VHHILLVEDEEHLAIPIKYNLEAEGYHVTTVGDGPQALALLRESPQAVDLIILDLMLPGMSGYDICETIRDAGEGVPILVLSARTLPEDRTRAYDAGADVYLMKPFDLEELLSVIRRLLSRQRSDGPPRGDSKLAGPVYRFGRAVVNFDTYQVTVDDKNLRLTTLELKLLRYFVEHEGSVVTRSELLEHVWGMSHSPTTRTVDNFIVNLRKYFELDPAQPKHFLSVRGAGYRFVAAGEETTEP
jgi:two-component system alkaline phosphatase synthesis response regulator PhoP